MADSAEKAISSMREKNAECCSRQCLKRLLDENEKSLRLFPEEWFQLEKKQQGAVLRFAIRLCSHWSAHTARGTSRVRSRFEFDDPVLGRLCRKAFAMITGIGEATLARHTAAVHSSSGRFTPSPHENEGKEGHHRIDLCARHEVISFLAEIASAVGEESSGRHSRRDEGGDAAEKEGSAVIFLPSMYSLRLLHHLYTERAERGGFPSEYRVPLMSFSRIFHSEEMSRLRIRSPRDDVCDVCLLYRRKMACLIKEGEAKATLEKLGGVSSDFTKHRELAVETRKVYRSECRRAKEGAERIQRAAERNENKEVTEKLLSQYEAHYSFDFAQNLWLPQIADTQGQFYCRSLRNINLFGIVDDGGTGTPLQTNMLYDQTAAGKGSSETVSMLHLFLTSRKPCFAARRVNFHTDNCVGQNKNNTMIHFFIWCIAAGIPDRTELKFMLKGHTKFSPDSGFGMIKKYYRSANVYTIRQVADAVKMSTRGTERNDAVILKNADFGDWKSALQKFFMPLKGISSFAVFIFDRKYPAGEVRMRGSEDDRFQRCNLLKPGLHSDSLMNSKTFANLQEHLLRPEQPQMKIKKRWDLYEKVRPYVPAEYQDIICPEPGTEKKSDAEQNINAAD